MHGTPSCVKTSDFAVYDSYDESFWSCEKGCVAYVCVCVCGSGDGGGGSGGKCRIRNK